MIKLDRTDKAILEILQMEGRLPNVELAQRIGLSESACHRRVKSLDDRRVITHYAAHLNRNLIGLSSTVFVSVTLKDQREESLRTFETAIEKIPEVMQCYLMTGETDYELIILIKDSNHYQSIHSLITRISCVSKVNSSLALRTILQRTKITIPA